MDGIGEPVWASDDSGVEYHAVHRRWADEIIELERTTFVNTPRVELLVHDDVVAMEEEFPEGCFVGLGTGGSAGEVVAIGFGFRTFFDLDHPQHGLLELIESNGSRSGDVPDGDWYYGTTIVVRPDHRRLGIGAEMYGLRKDVCRDLNLRGIVAGGVIPGFVDHRHTMSADDYIAAVTAGHLYDPTLTFQLENGFEAPCALADYMRNSLVNNYASLLVWHNTDHVPLIPSPPGL